VLFELAFLALALAQKEVSFSTFTALNRLIFDFDGFARSLKPPLQCPFSLTGFGGELLPSGTGGFDLFRICIGCQSQFLPFTCDSNGNALSLRVSCAGDATPNGPTQCIGIDTVPGFGGTDSSGAPVRLPVPVPRGTFQLLSSLTSLTWSRADPPVGLSELSPSGALQSLTLSGAATSVTTELQSLTSLTSLTITLPNVLTMPSGIGKLTRLASLTLETPNAALPSDLGTLTNVTTVFLRVKSGALPAAWSERRFQSFDATDSKLGGPLPLFSFRGSTCLLRGNDFDMTVSLCPIGCTCDSDLAVAPPRTLPPPPTPAATVATDDAATVVDDDSSVLESLKEHVTIAVASAAAAIVAVLIVGLALVFVCLKRAQAQAPAAAAPKDTHVSSYQQVPGPQAYTSVPALDSFSSARADSYGDLHIQPQQHSYINSSRLS
jgi:hypothetical protein